jgi:hypothetical protein
MKLGDKITKRTWWSGPAFRLGEYYVTGTVVYIHPEGRFYTLEFNFPGGTFRESFK